MAVVDQGTARRRLYERLGVKEMNLKFQYEEEVQHSYDEPEHIRAHTADNIRHRQYRKGKREWLAFHQNVK